MKEHGNIKSQYFILEPGDATRYEFIISQPKLNEVWISRDQNNYIISKDFITEKVLRIGQYGSGLARHEYQSGVTSKYSPEELKDLIPYYLWEQFPNLWTLLAICQGLYVFFKEEKSCLAI